MGESRGQGAQLRPKSLQFALRYKRLQKGRFAAPWKRSSEGVITLSSSELALFLEGSQLVFIGALSPPDVEPNRIATRPLTVA